MVVGVGVRLVRHGTLLVRNIAGAAQVVLSLGVVDEEFTVLAVAARLFPGDTHDVKDRLRLVEDGVHLLERAVSSLGVEKVHDGEDGGVTVIARCQPLASLRIAFHAR